jgi:hypothetical protein
MSWKVPIVIAALLFPLCAGADVYVKREQHTDGFYAGGSMTPPSDSVVEMWIGEKRLAYITETMKCVIDAEKQTLTFVNLRDDTYVETPLPLDPSKIFSEQELGQLQIFKRKGTIKPAGEPKKIGEWSCKGFETHDWIDYEGGKVSERVAEIWVTDEVPFDVKKYTEMMANMRVLSNLDDDYVEQMAAIVGFEVGVTETTYRESVAVETTTKTVELVEKEPPADAYGVPEGSTKKDLLTLADLRN